MNIIEYLNERNIKWFPISLDIIPTGEIVNGEVKYKKQLNPIYEEAYKRKNKHGDITYVPSYKEFRTLDPEIIKERQQFKDEYKHIWIDTNEYRQIDIDTPDMDNFKGFLEEFPYFKSSTKSYGFHIFMATPNMTFNKSSYTFRQNEDIEFLTGKGSYAPINAVVENVVDDDKSSNGYDDFYEWLNMDDERTQTQKVEIKNNSFEILDTFHKDILDNIDIKYYTHYNDWLKFIFAIKYTFDINALQIADEYSKKAPSYNSIKDIENKFNSSTTKGIGWGYLMSLSKKSNRENHYKIVSRKNTLKSSDDYNLAITAINLLGDDVIKCNGIIHIYKNPYWISTDNEKYKYQLEKCIGDELRKYYISFIKEETHKLTLCLENKEDPSSIQATLKLFNSIIHKINNSGINNITRRVIVELDDKDIEFDTYKPYYFCFKNCAFDLQTNKRVDVMREDYITFHTGYDYQPSNEQQTEQITELMNKIFPNEDERKCYISILRSGMIGLTYEKFILANGGGGNGKGLLNDLFLDMLGSDYGYKGSIQTLTQEIKGGANPEIANMNLKRFIKFEEPSDSDKLQLGTIKTLTGGDKINARKLYSGNTNTQLNASIILECNKKPRIDGRIDASIIRRFINIPFRSTFTTNTQLLECEGHFQANPYYKTKEFKNTFKYVLFDYLLTYNYTDIYEPVSIKEATKEYLYENDMFDGILSKYIKITEDETDFIQIKDLYKIYRDTAYREGTRHHKAFSMKKFMSMIDESLIWKQRKSLYFKDRRKINGKDYRNIFINMSYVNEDDEE